MTMKGMMDDRGFGSFSHVNRVRLKENLITSFYDLKTRGLIKDFHIGENGNFEIIPNYPIEYIDSDIDSGLESLCRDINLY